MSWSEKCLAFYLRSKFQSKGLFFLSTWCLPWYPCSGVGCPVDLDWVPVLHLVEPSMSCGEFHILRHLLINLVKVVHDLDKFVRPSQNRSTRCEGRAYFQKSSSQQRYTNKLKTPLRFQLLCASSVFQKAKILDKVGTLHGSSSWFSICLLKTKRTLTGRVLSKPVPEDIKTSTEYLCESTGVF